MFWAVAFSLCFQAKAFSSKPTTYDYVIAGGGTAGLTIAARLTEDPQTTVLVLEAGQDRSKDVNVLAPGLLTALYGNLKYDWDFHTVPQVNVSNRAFAHPRGKQLGGSSAINFLYWTHATQQDIDNWGALGNEGWSWDALEQYYTKSEHYVGPSAQTAQALQTQFIDPSLHGTSGPVYNWFPDIYGPLDKAWPRTYQTLGQAIDADPRSGLGVGGFTNLINMKPKNRSRSYAATTYLAMSRDRPNLKVIQQALVERILFHKESQDEHRTTKPVAIGVQYSTNGTSFSVNARHEVILSAGSLGSPHILELSGVGGQALLQKHGIDVVVDNANVGENLQDHLYVPVAYRVIPGVPTLDDLKNPKVFQRAYEEYIHNHTGVLATSSAASAFLALQQLGDSTSLSEDVVVQSRDNGAGYAAQYKLLIKDLHNPKLAIAHELSINGGISPQFQNDTTKLFTTTVDGNFFTFLGVLLHPFSRGYIHLNSANPADYPRIDPKYLSHPMDIKLLSAIALHVQRVAQAAPLSSLLQGNGTVYQPGYHKLTSDNVAEWIRSSVQSEYHPAGTCQMAPLSQGGVVDSRLRVYGVDNLRIVDASIIPLLPRGNIQTLVYAIAERAAEWIKQDK